MRFQLMPFQRLPEQQMGMLLSAKMRSAASLAFRFGHLTQPIRSVTVKNRTLMAAILVLSGAASSCGNSELKDPKENDFDGMTGICYRHISAIKSDGIKINRYESILFKSSGNLILDIERINQLEQSVRPLRDPHIAEGHWIAAWAGDRFFTNVHGPDCSKLNSVIPIQ